MAKKLIGGKLVETKQVEETSMELQAGEACKIDQFITLLQKNIQDRLGFELNKVQLNNLRYVFMDTVDEALMTCSSLILNKDYRLTRKYVQDRVTTPPKQEGGKNTLFKGHFEVTLRRSFHSDDYLIMGNYDAKKKVFKDLDGTTHKIERLDEDEIPAMVDEDIIDAILSVRKDFNGNKKPEKTVTAKKETKKPAAPKKEKETAKKQPVKEVEKEEDVNEELLEALAELTKEQLVEVAETCEVEIGKKDSATVIINKLVAEVDEADLLDVVKELDSDDDNANETPSEAAEKLAELTKEQLVEIANDNEVKIGKKDSTDTIIEKLVEEVDEEVLLEAIVALDTDDSSDDDNDDASDETSSEVMEALEALTKEQLVEIAETCEVEIGKKDNAKTIITKLTDEVTDESLVDAMEALDTNDEPEDVKEEPKKKAAPIKKEEEIVSAPPRRKIISKRP